jgi:hypothetical protein
MESGEATVYRRSFGQDYQELFCDEWRKPGDTAGLVDSCSGEGKEVPAYSDEQSGQRYAFQSLS